MPKVNVSQFKSKMLSIQNKYNRQIRNNQSRIKSELAKLQKNFNIRVKATYEV